jgi:hypothetical protein
MEGREGRNIYVSVQNPNDLLFSEGCWVEMEKTGMCFLAKKMVPAMQEWQRRYKEKT